MRLFKTYIHDFIRGHVGIDDEESSEKFRRFDNGVQIMPNL
jgi:hypothetical protein